MLPPNNLSPDESRVSVNETLYQANPKESYLVTVKRIFMYLKGTPNLGVWYPKGSGFDLKAYSDLDYVGCNLDRMSTSEGCQILGGKLVCWSAKKQSFAAMSSAEAEYVAAAGCCAQVLWIKSQLADYDDLYNKVPIFCDNTSIIAISNNLVLHSRTKHIDIRYHFIRDHILKGDIELYFVPTDLQVADIFTKPLVEPSFTRLVAELAEADSATKSITFNLSHYDKPLSFNLDVFSTVIGFEHSEKFVLIPPREIVKAGLATLGLTDENDTSLSSSDLINSSPLHPVTDKKERKSNICYTRYLSLILEHLLGEAYTNKNLKTLKSHHITALSFKTTLENETALTAHMYKVAELSPDPIKSFLPPSGEVNVDDLTDKSSSRTSMQPIIQPKAPTDLKPKKKRIPPSFKPKSSKQVRDVPQKKQVTETQSAEETMATADATQSLGASELAEDQVNQPQTVDAKKVKSSRLTSHGDVTFKQLMDEYDKKQSAATEESENPYDTEFEIKEAEHDDMDQRMEEPADFDLHSLPDDEMVDLNASADKLLDPLGQLRKEISSLTTHVQRLESSITHKVANKLEEYVPDLVVESLKATLPALISKSLKLAILEIIVESVCDSEKELRKVLKTKMGSSIRMKVRKGMKEEKANPDTQNPDPTQAKQQHKDNVMANAQREHPTIQELPSIEQAPPVYENAEHAPSVSKPAQTTIALVVHTPKEKDSEDKVSEEKPSPKRPKFLRPNPSTASPTPLSSILPQNMTMGQFTIFKITSSKYSPTPPRDESKGKGIVVEEEPLKQLLL
ncbi:hypothetical protein Tco_1005219 [Tanacetum coccineum]|uniref:Retrovirus-related Pol polyprotein from transposon TNT 1-94 n=1 Tax=Tanacetum coccineum TaxID=301880 RepID=A0ABQ5FE44_9ASTR